MKTLIILAIMLWASSLYARDVSLEWDANTEPDLAGYNIYQAPRMGNLTGAWVKIDSSSTTGYIVTGLPDGQNFAWLVTAYDEAGNESFASNLAELYDRTPPANPMNLRKVGP